MFALPIIGPILEAIVRPIADIFIKKEDAAVEKYKVDGKTKVSNNETDVSVIQARAMVAVAMKDDLGTKLCRDLIMFPVSVWVACKAFVLIFGKLIPEWTWVVGDWSDALQYIPYAVIAYLFVTAYRGK